MRLNTKKTKILLSIALAFAIVAVLCIVLALVLSCSARVSKESKGKYSVHSIYKGCDRNSYSNCYSVT